MYNLTFHQMWSQLGCFLMELYDVLIQSAVLYLVVGFFLLRWLVRHQNESCS